MEYVINYKVIIVERRNDAQIGLSVDEKTSETIINGNEMSYVIGGKPNFLYKIGIQAKHCAGFGDILWANTSCVTEAISGNNF